MSIFPLEQFEQDVEAQRRELEEYAKKQRDQPKSVVVRFGKMKLIGEYPYRGEVAPGCGARLIVRTHRGTEIGTLVTSTCPNAGCGSSVTRKQMLEFIEASGGKDFPFFSDGRALRQATQEDLDKQARMEEGVREMVQGARAEAGELGLDMRIVEAEPILGGERLTFYFTAEDRVDFRELARRLAAKHKTRIDLRQVGARDEARLTADYERCGQHCCCKQFLKVLKPVSMRSAKVQKATLDPLKISGRCGRLMCCLRYEDQTYSDLKKRLPHRKTRVGTDEGPGIVVDTQILTQIVLVELDADRRRIAVPLEELIDPAEAEQRVEERRLTTERELEEARRSARTRSRRDSRRARPSKGGGEGPDGDGPGAGERGGGGGKKKKKRRRGRSRSGGEGAGGDGARGGGARSGPSDSGKGGGSKKKRSRRRRGRGRGGKGKGGGSGGGSGGGGSGDSGGGGS